jgi:hypothetical protein
MKVCRQRKQMNGDIGMNRIVDNLREKRAKRLIWHKKQESKKELLPQKVFEK